MKIYSKSYSKHISNGPLNEHIAKTINNTTTYIHSTMTKYLLECIVDICARVGYNITVNYEEFQLTIFDTSFYLVVGTTYDSAYYAYKGVTCVTTEVVPYYNSAYNDFLSGSDNDYNITANYEEFQLTIFDTSFYLVVGTTYNSNYYGVTCVTTEVVPYYSNTSNNFLSGSDDDYNINIQLDVYATDNLLWVTYKYDNRRYTAFAIAKGFSIDRQENAIAINKGHVLIVNSQNEQNCTMSTEFSFCSWWSIVDSSGITRAITFKNIWDTYQPWSKDKLLLVPIIDSVGLFKFDELYHANTDKLYDGIPYTSNGDEYICWSNLCIMGGPDTLIPKS